MNWRSRFTRNFPIHNYVQSHNGKILLADNIRGCIFQNNRAYQRYAIYIEGGKCDTTISISNHNNFINNYEMENSSNGSGIIANEITSITKMSIEESNEFSNSENEGPISEHFIHVDYSDQRLSDEKLLSALTPTPEKTPLLYEIIITHDGVKDIGIEINNDDTNQSSLITVCVSNFTNINHNGNGGSNYVIDFGLKCDNLKFDNCSTSEAEGSIYAKDDCDLNKYFILENLNFNDCQAEYGGEVYIYSESTTDIVKMAKCTEEVSFISMK